MWDNSTITDAGSTLLSRWAGGGTLTITGAAAGTGCVDAVALAKQTALVNRKQSPPIVNYAADADGIQYTLRLTAADEGYIANQIGIFGKLDNGDETLIAIYQDETGIPIPDKNEMADFLYAFYATIQMNNGPIEVVIDPHTSISRADAVDIINSSSLRVDAAQALTDAQKQQARENISAAPAGYGLGTGITDTITTLEELDAFLVTGWKFIATDQIPIVDGTEVYYGLVRCEASTGGGYGDIFQTLISYGDVYSRYGQMSEGQMFWNDWGAEIADMHPGVEYRTADKHQWVNVYTKIVDCGSLPDNTSKRVAHGADASHILRVAGATSTGRTLPYHENGDHTEISADTSEIVLETNGSPSATGETYRAQIWYLKTGYWG